MTGEPDFREIADGGDLTPADEARLRRVHDLLLEAGPPAEVPVSLERARRRRRANVVVLPRRRVRAAVALAGGLTAAAFAVGFLVGDRGSAVAVWDGSIVMRGASDALATVRVGPADAGGNRPVRLRVSGLRPLPRGWFYELVLTKGDELGPTCGSFVVEGEGTTEVTMNAPYDLETWRGWVIVSRARGERASSPLLTT